MALPPVDPDAPYFTKRFINLADERLGAKALECSDEFFAPLQRMLNPEPAVFIPGKYDAHGKWMDGWESRRKRVAGSDWGIIRLARPGRIYGVDIDTSHFTGNYAPAASIEGCELSGDPDSTTKWFTILESTTLNGNSHHYLDITSNRKVSHLRINIYPDGGIARLRVFGRPAVDWEQVKPGELIDVAAADHGATIVAVNNEHFGLASNMLMPGRGVNMGDGWETRRLRQPGNDWCVIALAHSATIKKVEIDTAHFKGNYPDRCSLQASRVTGGTAQSIVTQCMFWPTLMAEQKLEMDKQHYFASELESIGRVTHVRLNIFPDGGVSRIRLWGEIV